MWAEALVAPGRFETQEMPAPGERDVPDGHVLLRALAGGICGSDLPGFRGRSHRHPLDSRGWASRAPGVPLHEIVGEVVFSRHPAHSAGDLVVGWATGFDGLAEFVLTDGDGVAGYDPALQPLEAITIQPLACVIAAVERIGDVRGRRVAVLGQGPIGLLFSHVLDQGGATVSGVDRIDREEVAGVFGVSETVTTTTDRWAAGLADADRPSVVVEAVGHQIGTMGDALDAVAPGGQIFYFGVPDDPIYPVSMRALYRKNLTLRSGFATDKRRVLAAADEYLRGHADLRRAYVSAVYGMDRVQEAFEAAIEPKPGQFKIALDMAGPGR